MRVLGRLQAPPSEHIPERLPAALHGLPPQWLPGLFMVALLTAPGDAGQTLDATNVWPAQYYAAGSGPRVEAQGLCRLLDDERTAGQSNALAFAADPTGAHESFNLSCQLHTEAGGEGGAFVFLSSEHYGERGPAPFVANWSEPNLKGTLAVAIDLYDPPNDEPFGPWGNTQGLPQREISLHCDGVELVKRVAPLEFRGEDVELQITVNHVVGGAEVSVNIAGAAVYEKHFVAGLQPYAWRLALGASTRVDATTIFDVSDIVITHGSPATTRRPPFHVDVFNHVLTDNGQTSYETLVELPPMDWAFGRVLLTLQLHDAGSAWDEWDRVGEVSVQGPDGQWLVIVPFITSYRTSCRWVVDVSAFRPLLSGTTRIKIAAGTTFYKNRGFMMSVALDYHHGQALFHGEPLQPFTVIPLWQGTAHYRSDENHFQDFFTPITVTVDEQTRAARIWLSTTGHGQVGEFTPSSRTLVFTPDLDANNGAAARELRYENTLWKSDCYLNPNRPQYGTWKYPRAGWAPGDVVAPWWIDLSDVIVPAAEARLSYESRPYPIEDAQEPPPDEGQINAASQLVHGYWIGYRTPAEAIAAPTLRITNVVGGSAAASAGLQVGDYLTSYDGSVVDTQAELAAAKAAALQSGREQVLIVAWRGAERLELTMASGQLGVNLSAP